MATYKLPETIEIFDELPFTPTGKIQRHVLVKRVLERRGRLVFAEPDDRVTQGGDFAWRIRRSSP